MFIISIGHFWTVPSDRNYIFTMKCHKGRYAQKDGFTEVTEHLYNWEAPWDLEKHLSTAHSGQWSWLAKPKILCCAPKILCHVTETTLLVVVLFCTCPWALLEGPFPMSLQDSPRARLVYEQTPAWISAVTWSTWHPGIVLWPKQRNYPNEHHK